MQQNIAIIYSPSTYRQYVAEATAERQTYTFRGARGETTWLKGHYAYLAVNGAESFLRRMGIKYDIVPDDTLTEHTLDPYHTILIPDAANLQNHARFAKWLDGSGRQLIVFGRTNLPADILGSTFEAYAAFSNPTGMQVGGKSTLLTPSAYAVRLAQPLPRSEVIAQFGEYTDPYIPIFTPGKHPAVLKYGRTLSFAHSVFEFIGAALQGHTSIESVRHFYPAFLFTDALLCTIRDLLLAHAPQLFQLRIKPWGAHDRVLVLRHDVDFSDDPTYIEQEIAERIPATYALLLDEYLDTWLRTLRNQEQIEISFHYSSAQPDSLLTRAKTRLARLRGDVHWGAAHPGKRLMSRDGLLEQIREAEARGIRCETAHRHENFFFYPETVDAMQHLYEHKKDVLGLGSMFRWECYQYGKPFSVEHPETAVPFWFPFKLHTASTVRHAPLRGWDSTQLMEPNPMETYAVLHSNLENGVFTLGFHPKHARSREFTPQGNLTWFRAALEAAKRTGCAIMTCAQVYEHLTALEALKVNRTGNTLTLHNTYWLPLRDLRIVVDGKVLNFKMLNAQQRVEKQLTAQPVGKSAEGTDA